MKSKNIYWIFAIFYEISIFLVSYYILTLNILYSILLCFFIAIALTVTRFWGTVVVYLANLLGYIYHIVPSVLFKALHKRTFLKAPVNATGREIPYYEWTYAKTKQTLVDKGYQFQDLVISEDKFRNYLADAQYSQRFADYYKNDPIYLKHKQIQHLAGICLRDPQKYQIWMDVASSSSPFPDIMRFIYNQEIYQQDLSYPVGLNGYKIGSNAVSIPLPDHSIDMMTLHCSFEHFEQTSDTGFLPEAMRLLRVGGDVVIAPIYLADQYCILSNPKYFLTGGIPTSNDDCPVMLSRLYWERHGRFYDANALQDRILDPARHLGFEITFYEVAVPPSVHYPPFSILKLRKC